MLDWLSSPQIQFLITAFLTLLTFFATLVVPVFQREKKVISCVVLTEVPLVTIQKEGKGKIQIQFDGNIVSDVLLTVFKIINTGNRAIDVSDYRHPVSIGFDKNQEILQAEVIESEPDMLQSNQLVSIQNGRIELTPILLNPGMSITIKTFVNLKQEPWTTDIEGLIVGGYVELLHAAEKKAQRATFVGALVGAILTIIPIVFVLQATTSKLWQRILSDNPLWLIAIGIAMLSIPVLPIMGGLLAHFASWDTEGYIVKRIRRIK